jgi:hypothetical protein
MFYSNLVLSILELLFFFAKKQIYNHYVFNTNINPKAVINDEIYTCTQADRDFSKEGGWLVEDFEVGRGVTFSAV